jgi:hypothetical protein
MPSTTLADVPFSDEKQRLFEHKALNEHLAHLRSTLLFIPQVLEFNRGVASQGLVNFSIIENLNDELKAAAYDISIEIPQVERRLAELEQPEVPVKVDAPVKSAGRKPNVVATTAPVAAVNGSAPVKRRGRPAGSPNKSVPLPLPPSV